MTIKQNAETLLTRYDWASTTRNGVECWVDPQGRTTDAIYLGPSCSIRKGYTKSTSRPMLKGLESLERFLEFIQKKVVGNEPK